ncbi:lysostaphin resistance A-like protein [Halobaculum sp. MBLA0147]|uniref:CPBP family intramembrane glutamic endopeptidase n=1 Tax=Halobaculum sp. MBLA0147 TaxID=3079934 RepID=UPI003525300B
MTALPRRLDRLPDVPTETRAWTALAAFGLATGGFVAGVVGILFTRPTAAALGLVGTEAFEYASGTLIQVGFAGFAVAYLLTRSDRERFVRVRRPSVEGVAWLLLGMPLTIYLGLGAGELLTTVLGPAAHHGAGGGELALVANLHLLPVAIGWQLLFAAPAEELVYRGIVHGRLRAAFDTVGVVLLGALAFGFMHFLVGLLTPGSVSALRWGLSTVVPGLVWGLAYERTDNLVVPAALHFASWTVPFETILPFV